MSDMLYYEGNHPDGVRAICKDCETVVLKDSEHEALETVNEHNEKRHGGDEVAGVCEWDLEPLITDDMPIEVKMEVVNSLDDDLSFEEKRKVLGVRG